jgi:cell division protein FtsB
MTTPKPRFRTVLWVLGGLLLTVLTLSGLKGYRDLRSARGREATVEREIEAARQRVETLRRRVEEERDDPVALEHLAREDLGMAHPDDVVIVLPKDEQASGMTDEGRGARSEGRGVDE